MRSFYTGWMAACCLFFVFPRFLAFLILRFAVSWSRRDGRIPLIVTPILQPGRG
jgi:hypothetical protein